MTEEDTAGPEEDAGTTEDDTGSTEEDAGTSEEDTGTEQDGAGSDSNQATDTGSSSGDTGSGTINPKPGNETIVFGEPDSGCNATEPSNSSPIGAALLALLLLGVLRRRSLA